MCASVFLVNLTGTEYVFPNLLTFLGVSAMSWSVCTLFLEKGGNYVHVTGRSTLLVYTVRGDASVGLFSVCV